MFKTSGEGKIDKAPGGDSNQLDLYKEFEAAEELDEVFEEKHSISDDDIEDREREERLINETLDRDNWDVKTDQVRPSRYYRELKNDDAILANDELNKVRDEIQTVKRIVDKQELEPEDLEKDQGYELFGRFAKYLKPKRKRKIKTKTGSVSGK